MKLRNIILKAVVLPAALVATSCHDLLDEPKENAPVVVETDYTASEKMIEPLLGAYGEFQLRGWEDYPIIAVRGDDVNAGGLGDQQDYFEIDRYNYNKDYWMINSFWGNYYSDIFTCESAIVEIEKYKEFAPNPALADQYIAEVKVLRAFLLFQLSRVWGGIIIPDGPDVTTALALDVSSKDEVMQHISDQMDEAAPMLPALRPNERTDIKGGVTRFTALAMKALANLELENYQGVADATGQIISSGKFSLHEDFYQLFKKPGKLSNENLLELQYSDFGSATGINLSYLFAFFGPQKWTPEVAGAGAGWGFYEPSVKWIKFMLDRNETVRLETSVLFTPAGIDQIKSDPAYADADIDNVTPSGDQIDNDSRALFNSGKHYLPTDQLTAGRFDYGTGKNFICIRYAEVLLMHAEALVHGATSSAMTADAAVNLVRDRADLAPISGVTLDQVMDEKNAELGMEWGTRYFDMVRLGRYDELSYEGRNFTEGKIFLPYPQAQVDLHPALEKAMQSE